MKNLLAIAGAHKVVAAAAAVLGGLGVILLVTQIDWTAESVTQIDWTAESVINSSLTMAEKVAFCDAFARSVHVSARDRDQGINKKITKQMFREHVSHTGMVVFFDKVIDQIYSSTLSSEQLKSAYQADCYKTVFTQ